MDKANQIPYVLLEIGSIQVYRYIAVENLLPGSNNDTDYKECFWQDKVSKHSYGPFPTIYDAMSHYTNLVATQKTPVIGEEWKAPVIYVDFVNKQRIVYEEVGN